MGRRGEVPVNGRRQAVLSLLRREEPDSGDRTLLRCCRGNVIPLARLFRLLERLLWPEAPKAEATLAIDRSPSSNASSKAETKSSAS